MKRRQNKRKPRIYDLRQYMNRDEHRFGVLTLITKIENMVIGDDRIYRPDYDTFGGISLNRKLTDSEITDAILTMSANKKTLAIIILPYGISRIAKR